MSEQRRACWAAIVLSLVAGSFGWAAFARAAPDGSGSAGWLALAVVATVAAGAATVLLGVTHLLEQHLAAARSTGPDAT